MQCTVTCSREIKTCSLALVGFLVLMVPTGPVWKVKKREEATCICIPFLRYHGLIVLFVAKRKSNKELKIPMLNVSSHYKHLYACCVGAKPPYPHALMKVLKNVVA
uniref:Uncharacterized protein n=1 Tax=Arundo donax TaxID=35708 RepID=A0A0A9E0I8_ARUDO